MAATRWKADVDGGRQERDISAMKAFRKMTLVTLGALLAYSSALGKGASVSLPKARSVFETKDGAKLGKWSYQGGGSYGSKGLTCCYAYFSQRNYTLLVLSSRDNDSPDRETVRSTFTVRLGARDLDTADCDLNGLDVIYAVWKRPANIIVIYYIDGGAIASASITLKRAERRCGGFTPDE